MGNRMKTDKALKHHARVQFFWSYAILILLLFATSLAKSETSPTREGSSRIQLAKCTSGKAAAEEKLKNDIRELILAARASGLKPAVAYESGVRAGSTAVQKVDHRATEMATRISRAAFAALEAPAPSAAASAASLAMNGSDRRRASLRVFAACSANATPSRIIRNQTVSNDEHCGTPASLGFNISQVHQSRRSPEQVRNALARRFFTSNSDETIEVCQNGCERGQGFREHQNGIVPVINKQYQVKSRRSSLIASMTNTVSHKFVNLEICGTPVHMATAFGNSHERGFDATSLLSLIMPISDRTIVIGDMSMQSFLKAGTDVSAPLQVMSKYRSWIPSRAWNTHDTIGKQIGSTEVSVMGEVSTPAGSMERTPARATR